MLADRMLRPDRRRLAGWAVLSLAIALLTVPLTCSPLAGARAASALTVPASESELFGVTCLNPRDCWAVGARMIRGGHVVTLIEHWNASRWSVTPSSNPSGSPDATLDAVSCASASACWAVGSYHTRSAAQFALAERWNGSRWTVVRTARPADSVDFSFASLSCPAARLCVAVGSNGLLTLAERWNGSRWLVTSSQSQGQESELGGVSCTSATSCWAVGDWFNRAVSGTITEHWNGRKWTLTRTGTSATTGAELSADSCRKPLCVAVGARTARLLAQRLASGRWVVQSPPRPAAALSAQLNSASCGTTAACMAVGFFTGKSAGDRALSEFWNGTKWRVVAAPSPSSQTQLTGISCTSGANCWAVGTTGGLLNTAKLIEHWNGHHWLVVH